jgi:hypothetical protein
MSTLSEITKRLEELPEQKKLKTLNNDVQTLTAKVAEVHSKLLDSSKKRVNAQLVFPDEEFSTTAIAVRAAARQAANVKELLEKDFSQVANRATEVKVTRLGERAKQAQDELAKTWPSLMQRQLKSYEAIAEVAAHLPGGAVLTQIMQRLRQHSDKPPATKQTAESVSKDVTALRKSVEVLGLEGEAGKFLINAAKGTADPRDLFKDEIRDYFEAKGLWHILAVTIK